MQNGLPCLLLAASLSIPVLALSAHGQELPNAPDQIAASSAVTAADAGGPVQQNQKPDGTGSYLPQDGKQTKRILGILPNFKSVSADQKLPPMSVKEKFIEASQDNFDYSSLALPAVVALYDLETNSTPEFGHGGVGYGRYFCHSLVDQTDENYWVEFIVPAVIHEDPRYYTMGRGGFKKRAIYSLTRIVINRTDSGKEAFNFSEVVGAGVSSGISNLYYPSPERSVGKTLDQYGTNLGIDALSFMFKEFWPDINNKLFHGSQ
jgi:hypothetical protein